MKKVIRVRTESDLEVLNALLDDGWDIFGWTDMPFVTAVAPLGKSTGIKVFGGWSDYILEISKEQREMYDGTPLSSSKRSH